LLDWPEIILRLGAATLAGGLIGLNRDLQGKPIGLRTLGLVGLATAMVVLLAESFGNAEKVPDAVSRVIQGILTGIGFLGAGVIIHRENRSRVQGLPARHLPGSRPASALPAAQASGGSSPSPLGSPL
jgi:putative Mg2+ transporter-C (MgtC) family protein